MKFQYSIPLTKVPKTKKKLNTKKHLLKLRRLKEVTNDQL